MREMSSDCPFAVAVVDEAERIIRTSLEMLAAA
jgi:hypothetical protein